MKEIQNKIQQWIDEALEQYKWEHVDEWCEYDEETEEYIDSDYIDLSSVDVEDLELSDKSLSEYVISEIVPKLDTFENIVKLCNMVYQTDAFSNPIDNDIASEITDNAIERCLEEDIFDAPLKKAVQKYITTKWELYKVQLIKVYCIRVVSKNRDNNGNFPFEDIHHKIMYFIIDNDYLCADSTDIVGQDWWIQQAYDYAEEHNIFADLDNDLKTAAINEANNCKAEYNSYYKQSYKNMDKYFLQFEDIIKNAIITTQSDFLSEIIKNALSRLRSETLKADDIPQYIKRCISIMSTSYMCSKVFDVLNKHLSNDSLVKQTVFEKLFYDTDANYGDNQALNAVIEKYNSTAIRDNLEQEALKKITRNISLKKLQTVDDLKTMQVGDVAKIEGFSLRGGARHRTGVFMLMNQYYADGKNSNHTPQIQRILEKHMEELSKCQEHDLEMANKQGEDTSNIVLHRLYGAESKKVAEEMSLWKKPQWEHALKQTPGYVFTVQGEYYAIVDGRQATGCDVTYLVNMLSSSDVVKGGVFGNGKSFTKIFICDEAMGDELTRVAGRHLLKKVVSFRRIK